MRMLIDDDVAVMGCYRLVMCGAHDAIYELTAYRDPNLVPIKCFYGPDPRVKLLQHRPKFCGSTCVDIQSFLLA